MKKQRVLFRFSVSTYVFFLTIVLLLAVRVNSVHSMEISRNLFSVPSSRFHFTIDIGLGNISSIYLTCGKNQFSYGLGCGYIYYTDPESSQSINSLSPGVIVSTTVANLLILRQRAGMDFVGLKGYRLTRTGFIFSSDLLVKIFKLKESAFCAGASVPILIGKNGFDLDTVIGVSYIVDF